MYWEGFTGQRDALHFALLWEVKDERVWSGLRRILRPLAALLGRGLVRLGAALERGASLPPRPWAEQRF